MQLPNVSLNLQGVRKRTHLRRIRIVGRGLPKGLVREEGTVRTGMITKRKENAEGELPAEEGNLNDLIRAPRCREERPLLGNKILFPVKTI